jgi:death-on-curing protein
MTPPTAFLTVDHVVAIHRRMIEEFGGDPALRDRGLLESAVAMPEAQFGGQYLHEDLAEQAAAYLFHLCRNHAFVDGNKRVALASAEVFLRLNGAVLAASNEQLEALTLGVASGRTSKSQVVDFFRDHVQEQAGGA